MMFDTLGVCFGNALGNAELEQELEDEIVPLSRFVGKPFSLVGEKDAPVRFLDDKSFADESLDRLANGDLTDAEPLGQIDGAGLSFFGD